jgi:hypothetical protein
VSEQNLPVAKWRSRQLPWALTARQERHGWPMLAILGPLPPENRTATAHLRDRNEAVLGQTSAHKKWAAN